MQRQLQFFEFDDNRFGHWGKIINPNLEYNMVIIGEQTGSVGREDGTKIQNLTGINNIYQRQVIYVIYQQNLMKNKNTDNEDVKEMVMRVLSQKDPWLKHVAHNCCKCEKCTCGKHKCKISPPKYDMKMGNTTYNESYQKKKSYADLQSKPHFDTYHPGQFINKSQYREEYYRKQAKRDQEKGKKKPDNIGLTGGPNFATTSYQESFTPKKNAKREPIKNPENLNNLGLRMTANSSYKDTFNYNTKPKGNSVQPIKQKDNLKTEGAPFTGTTSYGHDFSGMKPYKKDKDMDNFGPNNRYAPVHGVRPKSSYKCDYGQKKIIRCPAESCCC